MFQWIKNIFICDYIIIKAIYFVLKELMIMSWNNNKDTPLFLNFFRIIGF